MTATRPPGARPLLESQIQQQCAHWLALDGWRALKTDPCSDRGRAKGFGELGMADHLFLRPMEAPVELNRRAQKIGRTQPFPAAGMPQAAFGQILWVEFKRPGTSATEHQLTWHFAERVRGFLTAIAGVDFAPTFEGFTLWYYSSGLLQREI
jgi:hypothetical protein